jgi:hypothetical protein
MATVPAIVPFVRDTLVAAVFEALSSSSLQTAAHRRYVMVRALSVPIPPQWPVSVIESSR